MKLDWRFVSREFKEKFKEIQALGPGTRMHFCLAPQAEFNGKSLADVYGLIKLERQEWRVSENEFMTFQPQKAAVSTQQSAFSQATVNLTAESAEGSGSSTPQPTNPGASGDRIAPPQQANTGLAGSPGNGPSENQQLAQSGRVEPLSGIPVEHLAMFKPAEAMDLVDRARQREYDRGYEAGRKAGADSARYDVERKLRAQMGLPEYWQEQPSRIEWHRQQLKRLVKADEAPRCEKIFANGTKCRSPKMKGKIYCYAHEQAERIRPKKIELLLMEDGNSVIVNIALVQKALLDGQITSKEAGQLFYSIQTSAAVLKRVTFRDTKPEEMVTKLPRLHRRKKTQRARRKEHSAVSTQHSANETVSENGCGAESSPARQDNPADGTNNVEGSVRGETDASGIHTQQPIPGDELNKSFVPGDEGEGGTPIGSSGHREIGTSGFGPSGTEIEGAMEQKAG